jgi:hypothetical protein
VRKATIADVASRISDLEKTIVAASIDHANNPARRSLSANAYANTHVSAPAGLPVSLPVSPHESPREPQELPSEEVLIRNGTSSQYFNELLISKVIEEVSIVRISRHLCHHTNLKFHRIKTSPRCYIHRTTTARSWDLTHRSAS